MVSICSITSDADREDLEIEIAECERYEERMAYGKRPADPEYAAKLATQRAANLRGLERLRKLRNAP